MANIIPIPKAKKYINVDNYRLFSLLFVISKLLKNGFQGAVLSTYNPGTHYQILNGASVSVHQLV